MNTAEIQRIMRGYYKQLYASKMDNLEEMDKFLEMHNLLRLNQEEIENINRPITRTKIETVIKNLTTKKAQDQMASQVNSIKHLKRSKHFSIHVLIISIMLIPKPEQSIMRKVWALTNKDTKIL